MTEQLDFGWVYDLNPLATFRMVTRLERLTEEAGHLDHKQHSILELREREGLFRYVVQRQFDPTATARGPRFFGSKPAMLKLTQIWQPSNWDGTRKYDTVGEISGMPVQIAGSGAVTPIGAGGTRYSVSLTVTSSARKVETAVAESLSRTVQAEHGFRVTWLQRQSHSGF